jgi:hypothetical protein
MKDHFARYAGCLGASLGFISVARNADGTKEWFTIGLAACFMVAVLVNLWKWLRSS